MISEAVKAYEAKAKTPDSNRPIQTTPPKIPHLQLSLVHDTIMGNVRGSLGKKVDKKLGLFKDQQGSKYMNLMVGKVGEMTIRNRESEDKASRKAKRKLCKSEGCGNFAWNGGGGHCYDHADLSKRLCCKCEIRTRKYAGGLCGPCREPSTGIQEKVYCPECGVREPVRRGSRCKRCIGSSYSGSKKKKAAK